MHFSKSFGKYKAQYVFCLLDGLKSKAIIGLRSKKKKKNLL